MRAAAIILSLACTEAWARPRHHHDRKLVLRNSGGEESLAAGVARAAALVDAKQLDEAEALNGVTKTAAEVLGVADRVGSLVPGRDADFIVVHGAPLDAAASVSQVYIEGSKVWDRASRAEEAELAASNAVVLRAGTLWTGNGAPMTGGVEVLLKDGKIVAHRDDYDFKLWARQALPGPIFAFLDMFGDGGRDAIVRWIARQAF